MPTDSIKRKRSREERARKVVQGIRQRLKAGHLPDRKIRKGWKKTSDLLNAPFAHLWRVRSSGSLAIFAAIRRASSHRG